MRLPHTDYSSGIIPPPPVKRGTVWEDIDLSMREKVNLQDYVIGMEIEPREKGMGLHLSGNTIGTLVAFTIPK